jgi:hypothetical protein
MAKKLVFPSEVIVSGHINSDSDSVSVLNFTNEDGAHEFNWNPEMNVITLFSTHNGYYNTNTSVQSYRGEEYRHSYRQSTHGWKTSAKFYDNAVKIFNKVAEQRAAGNNNTLCFYF